MLAGFDASVAVALGNITIVGGSLSNFIFNAPRRHAFLNRPLIDWDLILVPLPLPPIPPCSSNPPFPSTPSLLHALWYPTEIARHAKLCT